MMEVIAVGIIVAAAVAFIAKNLYHKAAGDAVCDCEGKVCQEKKKKAM